MKFSIEIDNKEGLPVIHLKNETEETSAEIYAFGALLNSFKIKNSIELIDGFASQHDAKNNITNGFKSARLSPFVCRVTNGEYIFNAHEYKINKFYMGKEAIHGLLYDAIFSIIDSGANDSAAFVSLQYNYTKKDEGFPFNYACTVNYSLVKNNCLVIESIIKNNSGVAMPVCDGWHPYFTLGTSVNELTFQMNADKMIEFNERLVPTGKIVPYKKFQQPEIFGETFLDNCFLLNKNSEVACVLRNEKSGVELTIQPDNAYPYLQIYTPEHRKSIAIENLSAAPDAFNNKMGLAILNAGESISFKTGFRAAVKL